MQKQASQAKVQQNSKFWIFVPLSLPSYVFNAPSVWSFWLSTSYRYILEVV